MGITTTTAKFHFKNIFVLIQVIISGEKHINFMNKSGKFFEFFENVFFFDPDYHDPKVDPSSVKRDSRRVAANFYF